MRIVRARLVLLLVATLFATMPVRAADPLPLEQLSALARRGGLRVLESRHLTLVTDRPARDGDGVEDLPAVFDEAWSQWCAHYGLDAESLRDWRAFGCLVVDRERFQLAGLLPEWVPHFANGHCHADRFWLMDQSNPDYRRHLVLHEGVHAFTLTVRGLDAPTWYTEGIAEYLATHRLAAAAPRRFVPTPIPSRAEDVEQLGRVEKIRALRERGGCPGLADVFAMTATEHRDLADYAASWAAVALLARHPHHAPIFAALEQGPLDATFTERLRSAKGWDTKRASRDFDAFTDEIDYGYDFTRSAIDWSPGQPLISPQRTTIVGDRGWQNTGWSLAIGRRYSFTAAGRCTIGSVAVGSRDAATGSRPLVSTAEGISLRWYRGRPAGRLLLAQWVEPGSPRDRPGFVILAAGGNGSLTAAVDGPVFCKVNDPPGELADNEGSLDVVIAPGS